MRGLVLNYLRKFTFSTLSVVLGGELSKFNGRSRIFIEQVRGTRFGGL